LFLEQINEGLSKVKFISGKKGDKKMREAQFTKSLTVVLPMGDYQKIKQITDAEKTSMAQWVRKVVNVALKSDAVEEE
jgi:hypothetical protein